MRCTLLIQEIKRLDNKSLIPYKDCAKPATKAQLRANFFNCKQRANETVGAFRLRLREMFFRWQERDEGGTEDRDDLLLDQLMGGLRTGPIK